MLNIQRGASFGLGTLTLALVGWSLCLHRATPQVVLTVTQDNVSPSHTSILKIPESDARGTNSVQVEVAALKAQVAELSTSLKSMQVARLHDKYTASEQKRVLKAAEEAQIMERIATATENKQFKLAAQLNTTLVFVRAEHLAQYMIKERLLDDMRALLYPGFKEGPDNSTTYVSQDLPDDFDNVVPMLKTIPKTQMNGNAYGVWAWRKGAKHLGNSLIVISGDKVRKQTANLLLNQGFVLWKRRLPCPGRCRELFSYITYLADDSSPAKPLPQTVAFIHGHIVAWHQHETLLETIYDSIDCSEKTKAYVPMGHHGMPLSNLNWGRGGRFALNYIDTMGEFGIPKGINFTNFCCAQFVLTKDLINRHSMAYYKTFFEKKMELRIDAYTAEYAWGWMFGDPEERNATRGPPEVCAKKYTAEAPFVRTSRSGQWTNPAARPRVTFVLGGRSRNDTASSAVVDSLLKHAPSDTSVWQRHKCFWCSAQWRGEHCCGYTKGYLSFINTFKNDEIRPESDYYVFLKGAEPFTKRQVDGIMGKVDCARKAQRYTPLHTERHLQTSHAAGHMWLTNLTDHTYGVGEPLRAFSGSEFVVPHEVLVNAAFNPLQVTFEHFHIECGVRRTNPDTLDHHWHWFMGEAPTMVDCPAGSPVCAACNANPKAVLLEAKDAE